MVDCLVCGRERVGSAKYCPECGSRQPPDGLVRLIQGLLDEGGDVRADLKMRLGKEASDTFMEKARHIKDKDVWLNASYLAEHLSVDSLRELVVEVSQEHNKGDQE